MKKLILFIILYFLSFSAIAQVQPDLDADKYDIFAGTVKSIEIKQYSIKTGGLSEYKTDNYEFNTNNKITSYNNGAGTILLGSVNKNYTYDSKNKLTESVEYDDLFGDLKTTYTYDNKGNLTQSREVSTDALWGYTCDLYYTTDKKGNVLTEKKNFSGEPGSSTVFTWKKGLLIKKETFKTDNSFDNSYEYEYNKDGRMVKKIYRSANGEPQTTTYIYNDKGLEVSNTNYYGSTQKNEYLNYDSKGNWIRRKITYTDKLGTVTSSYFDYRKIVYYDGTISSAFNFINSDDKINLTGIDLNSTTWTHKAENNFSINIPGYTGFEDFKGLFLYSGSKHVICYEKITNATFLLKDFSEKDSGYTGNAVYLGNTDAVYWVRQDSNYWIYHNGKSVSNNKSFWLGDDLIVYVTDLNRTFKLPNYKNKEQGTLHKAVEVTNNENTYFKKSDNTYWLYIEGKGFDFKNPYKTAYVQNDLLLYSINDKKTYILKNYKTTDDDVLGKAELISTSAEAFVYKTTSTGSYYLLIGGKYHDAKKTSKYAPNGRDIIITLSDTEEKYMVTDFKSAGTYQLLEAKKVK